MNRTKEELLLDCIKQFEHIEDVLGYNRLTTTKSLINEINRALTIPVVGRSEQLVCDCGNKLTDKEIYFGQCLQCDKNIEEAN